MSGFRENVLSFEILLARKIDHGKRERERERERGGGVDMKNYRETKRWNAIDGDRNGRTPKAGGMFGEKNCTIAKGS